MKSQTAILLLVGLLVVYGVTTTLSEGDRSVETAAEYSNPIKVMPHELRKAYTANTAAADQKYAGQILELQGMVDGISSDLGSGYVVRVWSGEEGEATSWGVDCYFGSEAQSEIAKLAKGHTVVVRGRLEAGAFASSLGPSLKNAVFVP